jgi:hypothetical protein
MPIEELFPISIKERLKKLLEVILLLPGFFISSAKMLD